MVIGRGETTLESKNQRFGVQKLIAMVSVKSEGWGDFLKSGLKKSNSRFLKYARRCFVWEWGLGDFLIKVSVL